MDTGDWAVVRGAVQIVGGVILVAATFGLAWRVFELVGGF